MRIEVSIAAYYEWELMDAPPAGALPGASQEDQDKLRADQLALKFKVTGDDQWSQKVLVEEPTVTSVGIPEAAVLNGLISLFYHGTPKTRAQWAADYLATVVLPHHTHASCCRGFEVKDDGPVESLAVEMLADSPLTEEQRAAFLDAYMADSPTVHDEKSCVMEYLNAHLGVKE